MVKRQYDQAATKVQLDTSLCIASYQSTSTAAILIREVCTTPLFSDEAARASPNLLIGRQRTTHVR